MKESKKWAKLLSKFTSTPHILPDTKLPYNISPQQGGYMFTYSMLAATVFFVLGVLIGRRFNKA
ncbi:MAG: hypothetical protein M1438_21275 [Deltaproteobacteria bacterium]|nr:hypothetical protein [Deltaproteobacteria bacterium]